jgi:hypothetical protein
MPDSDFEVPEHLKWTPPAADPDAKLKLEAQAERVRATEDWAILGEPLRITKTWQERKAEIAAKAAAEKEVADRAAKTKELEAGVAKLQKQIAEAEAARIRPEMRKIAAARMRKGKKELSLPDLRERAVASLAKGDKR